MDQSRRLPSKPPEDGYKNTDIKASHRPTRWEWSGSNGDKPDANYRKFDWYAIVPPTLAELELNDLQAAQ